MNNKVNWFWCIYCKKDVTTNLEAYIDSIVEYNRTLIIEVRAICEECGNTISIDRSAMNLRL